MDFLKQLQLLQLADSALPIGSAAHSFGLETLAAEGILTPQNLEAFLQSFIEEGLLLETVFCRRAYSLGLPDEQDFMTNWVGLNQLLSAFKPARESREASLTLGRRFLQLVLNLDSWPLLQKLGSLPRQNGPEVHYCAIFGLMGSQLGVETELTSLAYLNQTVTSLISACQRLMPLGQSQAGQILWRLKPELLEIVRQSQATQIDLDSVRCFMPMVEMASMRHPLLSTRLFIS